MRQQQRGALKIDLTSPPRPRYGHETIHCGQWSVHIMSHGRIILLSRGLTCAAVLLLVQFVSVRPGHASCGDYLMVGGESHEPATAAPVDEPAEPCPCRGPECHQTPEAPLPTAPERTFSTDHDRWCAAVSGEVPQQPGASRLAHQGPLLVPEGFPATIDRPPRAEGFRETSTRLTCAHLAPRCNVA
jgi:hypothetical protein